MDRWLCALLLGYFISFTFSKPLALTQWLLAATLVAVWAWRYSNTRALAILLGCVLCGIGWGSGNAYLVKKSQFNPAYFGQSHSMLLKVEQITQVRPEFWRVEGRVHELNQQLLSRPPRVRLNWYEPPLTPKAPPQAGTFWRLQAKLKAPQGVRNDGGFLYHRYLVSRNIQALGSITAGHYQSGQASLRQRLFNQLTAYRDQLAQFGVLVALTLGERQALTDSQWHLYQRTGLAHLIAISGLHLSLVAGFVLLISRYFSRYWARSRSIRERLNAWHWGGMVALLAALGYAALAGFATATLRAFAMFSVVILHKSFALHTPPSRVLLRAVVLVLLVEPMALLQSGFWLSVCAVAAILIMQWRLLPIQGRWRTLRALWRLEVFLTLALWPLTAMWFGGLPLLAPVTNLLLVPLVTVWVLPFSLLGLCLLLLQFDSAAYLALRLAELPLNWLQPLLQRVADAPWQWLSAEVTGAITWIVVALFIWLMPMRWLSKLIATLGLVLALLIGQELERYDQSLFFHVLDVDQGSAMVIALGQQAILIDTGANWELGGNMAERAIIPFLRKHQLQPNLAFVSHTDNDHQGGVALLKQHYPKIRWFGGGHGGLCTAGQSGQWRGRVKWQVLHPRELNDNDNNDDSCVLLVELDYLRILIPGDISKRAERALLAYSAQVQADILVLAHHGSNSSSEAYFLQAVNPALAIASRGRNNAYGMVAKPVRERLNDYAIPLWDTATGGQISIQVDPHQWSIRQPWAAVGRAWFDADH